MVDAVVLAGSLNDGPLKGCSPVLFEALIPIGEKVMVEYVVEALLDARNVGNIQVVGPASELAPRLAGERVKVTEATGGIMGNIETGLDQLAGAGRVLLATSDIPLLTPQAVDNFIELCGDMKADLYYPIIPRQVVEERFASTQRTYGSLREGVFTGGNLFLINPAVFKQCVDNGQKIIRLRKNPLGLCRLLGFIFVLKFLTRSLTLAEVQRKVAELLGIRGAAVISNYPEVGVDVDKPGDLELVLQVLGVR